VRPGAPSHSSHPTRRQGFLDREGYSVGGACCKTGEAGARAAARPERDGTGLSLRQGVLDPGFHRVMPVGDERSTRLVRGPAHQQHRQHCPGGRPASWHPVPASQSFRKLCNTPAETKNLRDHGRRAISERISMIAKGLLLPAVAKPSRSWPTRRRAGDTVAGAARVDGVISRLPGIGNCIAGPGSVPRREAHPAGKRTPPGSAPPGKRTPRERGSRRNADPAGTRTGRIRACMRTAGAGSAGRWMP
jgi:hypothetical protein